MKTLDERFFSKVYITSGCWLWTASGVRGYGRIWINNAFRAAHRVAYEQISGPIPAGLEIDHLCRNRACVRPDHLEPVTGKENRRRGLGNGNTQKTHCPRGHPYGGANLYLTPDGRRECRECRRRRGRNYRARLRAGDGK